MKFRIIPLALFLAALLLSLAGPAAASPADLAVYFPEETALFVSIRTDDDFLETLDALILSIGSRVDMGDLPEEPIPGLLDELLGDALEGASFATDVRPWLGAAAAVGVTLLDDEAGNPVESGMAALSVADADAALEFAVRLLEDAAITETETYTLLVGGDASVLVADDVMLIGEDAETVTSAYEGDIRRLDTRAGFVDMLVSLPLSEYDLLAYLDGAALGQPVAMGELGSTMPLMLFDTAGASGLAVGFALLDGRSLVIDMAVIGAEAPFAQSPVDPNFARYIPADAQFVVHGSGLGVQVAALLESLETLLPMFGEQFDDESAQPGFGFTRESLDLLFFTATGLRLQDDVLGWMTGDYAFFGRLLPLEGEVSFALDLAFVTEATDPDAAANLVTALARLAGQNDMAYTTETINGAQAVVLPEPLRSLLAGAFSPDELDAVPELDLLVAAGDEVFAVGSRPGVSFALNPTGDSLLDNPAYAYAAGALFLDDPYTVLFVDAAALARSLPEVLTALETLETDITGLSGQGTADLIGLLELFESASVTVSGSGDSQITRLAFTLAESVAGGAS